MSIGDHLRENWVEYLLLAVLVFVLAKNKKAQKFVKNIIKKTKKSFTDFMDE